ncbi:MAG: hypothetical protein ACFCD0_06965 [Gemmataceae bacterium]
MILQFPNLDTLHLAMTSKQVPADICTQSAVAGFAEDGSIFVEPSAAIPQKVSRALKKLGVSRPRSIKAGEQRNVLCWPQMFDLQSEAVAPTPGQQMPVLFEIPDASRMPEFAGEMLRLGNDRQSFRYLKPDDEETAAFLRVIGPPYYSLLRALDRDDEYSPRAYVEKSPGVWVEFGYTHPFLAMIEPPAGQLLLLRPPNEWIVVEEAGYRDVYDLLDLKLPNAKADWKETEHKDRLKVSLRLVAGSASEIPELWVLRDNPMAQLDAFVRSSSDQLLARLSFAVGKVGKDDAVILRVRPSRQAPPAIVLDGVEFRPYRGLSNLFVPCGRMVHPPLRRDALRNLLAEDPDQITWLYPHEDGTFTPESLPDKVFRPLPDWIEYIFTRERVALESWIEASVFDFEKFVCKDDKERESKPKDKKPGADKSNRNRKETEGQPESTALKFKQTKKKKRNPDPEVLESLDALPKQKPSELQIRQQELEKEFLGFEGPLDLPERRSLWPELATIYGALENLSDSTICWANALWDDPEESAEFTESWHLAARGNQANENIGKRIDAILEAKEASPADVRRLTSVVLHSANQETIDEDLQERLGPIQRYLETHENLLPIRAVWLASLALYRLTGQDVLTLARARDRILERLLRQQGLTIEQDLPAFLRFTGQSFSDRFQEFRDWLIELPKLIHKWVDRMPRSWRNTATDIPDDQLAKTKAYVDLMLAFGFTRLGMTEQATPRLEASTKELGSSDAIHGFLLQAFRHRIDQASQGGLPEGPLPAKLFDLLANMDQQEQFGRFKAERLREKSRILEPHTRLNAFRHHGSSDDLDTSLHALFDISDKGVLESRIWELFQDHAGKGSEAKQNEARILSVALEIGPQIGETFALMLLEKVAGAFKHVGDLEKQALLLERALFVAAHFDQSQYVQEFVLRFKGILQDPKVQDHLGKIADLAWHCFRGLRKLGLQDQVHQLLGELKDSLLQGKSIEDMRLDKNWSQSLRSLLHVASGYFYFGREEEAQPIVEEARRILYKDTIDKCIEHREVACAYVAMLAQAPVQTARQLIEEVLRKLENVADDFATKTHYSLSQLLVVEAIVRAIVTEDFAMGNQTRRWLDDDEFLVRRRIHADLNEAMQRANH